MDDRAPTLPTSHDALLSELVHIALSCSRSIIIRQPELCFTMLAPTTSPYHSTSPSGKSLSHGGAGHGWPLIIGSVILRRDSPIVLASHGGGDKAAAVKHLKDMGRRSIDPTEESYNSVINACARVGDSQGAEVYLRKMCLCYNKCITTGNKGIYY